MVHHLNRLVNAGLVIHRRNRYELRMKSLTKTVEEVEKDILCVLEDIKEITSEIGNALNFPNRRGLLFPESIWVSGSIQQLV